MSGIPEIPPEWADDDRVAYSKEKCKWIREEDDGTEYEFDEKAKMWIPVIDNTAIARQQQIYGGDVNDESGSDKKKSNSRKRPRDDSAIPYKKRQRVNTGIYISNLPVSTTEQDLHDAFSRYGVIAEDLITGERKIKLYKDEQGNPKGDALIVYFKPQSVDLAVQLMDQSYLPTSENTAQTARISVQPAQFSDKEANKTDHRKLTDKEKTKVQRKLQKLEERLADWDEDDENEKRAISSKRDRTVVLKHVFTLDEIEQDPAAILDIKSDIREGCEEIGAVSSVTLFDLESEGIVTVRFRDPLDAQKCIQRMHGRYFGGNKLEALLDNGTKYNKSS